MIDEQLDRPDILLTLDSDGVIRDAVGAQALADENLERWRGVSWEKTVEPGAGRRASLAIEQSRRQGESTCFQVNQKLPSGREAPIEYTMICLGKKAGFVAIGRNLQSVADLQSRLVESQQARERDYWRLREVETRYRALLDASRDAVALVRTENLRVVEANVLAAKALKLVPGAEFLPDLPARDRKALASLLDAVRGQGRAPGIALHLASGAQWSLRASLLASEAGSFYLFQMVDLAGAEAPAAQEEKISVEDIIDRFPDAFAVVDRDGIVKHANYTFLDLAQVGVETAVVGQNLKRWLSQPGADADVVLGIVARHGSVRRMPSRLEGALGASTQVEISAVGNRAGPPGYIGLLLRDAAARTEVAAPAYEPEIAAGDGSLESLVKAAVETVERKGIAAAIEQSRGNRTVAAKTLGMSRQSLHAKMKKYRLDLR